MCSDLFFLGVTALCLSMQIALMIYYKYKRNKLAKQFEEDMFDTDEEFFEPSFNSTLNELYIIHECTKRPLVIDGDCKEINFVRCRY